ncbi:DUF1330 domain-containing protein [Oceanicoccus sp. KOV_DT_Chl]|uniref:DUF1330 domain-containing protein n=1 Tax=Oceanicoccus sp. KOV_DT_Chl TaxID=1904639 RepID=UPI000C7E306A|nr:DUF1330 domain-containing protein [Oceanicoccus sp. KOV_DT_Chl]
MYFERIMGIQVIDDEEYQKYREAMMPILDSFGGRFGYDFKVSEVLMSKSDNEINRVFTLEFPNSKTMQEFFSNPAYIKVKNKHFKPSVASTTVISMHERNS